MPEYLSAEEIAAVLRREGDESISARTVHYYAEQKLLPPPEYDGTRPRYTGVHLEAMREARRRKRGGQRLREIAPSIDRLAAGPIPAAARPPAAPQAPVRSGGRTIAVAPGLTLAAEGWSDEDLNRIARAILDAVAAREQTREGESS